MKIRFIWIGKTKFRYISEGVSEYSKRLSHYCKTEILELKDVHLKSNANFKKAESNQFERYLNSKDFNICLDENGKNLTSQELADFISKLQNRSVKNVNMLIGGAHGWSSDMLRKSDFNLSLSRMTLPHDLCRLVLLEQVYRAFTIVKGEKYHNP